jgi:hypothetical protein
MFWWSKLIFVKFYTWWLACLSCWILVDHLMVHGFSTLKLSPWSILIMSQPHFGQSVRMRLTPKSGNLKSSRTPATSELNSRRQNTSPWGVLYTVGKFLKCRCPKWPHMNHLDICSPSYGQKKGRESNWQFDSRPLKVGNRPFPDVCRRSAMGHCKALEESYNFGSDLTLIGGRSQEIWVSKVPKVQPGTVSGLLLGSAGKKMSFGCGSRGVTQRILYGEGGGFPQVRAVVSQMSPRSPVACPNTKRM